MDTKQKDAGELSTVPSLEFSHVSPLLLLIGFLIIFGLKRVISVEAAIMHEILKAIATLVLENEGLYHIHFSIATVV